MGLYFGDCRETRVGYIPDNICGFGLKIKESRQEFNIMSRTNKQPKKDNIEYKVEKQGMNKEPYIPVLNSIERKIENYRQ